MRARTKLKLLLCIVVIAADIQTGLAQNISSLNYRFVFYNVENLFDTKDDSLTRDEDFLPDGILHWTETRYWKKINSIYKVLTAAGEWNPPALAGFCEVENRKVLQDLVFDTYLSKYQYGIVMGESDDPRGIRIGIIFRKDILKLIYSRNLLPVNETESGFRTRKILYTKWLIRSDTVHLFLNHWPSRRGGVLAGENLRRSLSATLTKTADSLFRNSGGAVRLIIAGDFNCTPGDPEMMEMSIQQLVNLSAPASSKGEGTFRYKGTWEMIDQVIVSGDLINANKGIYTRQELLSIFKPDFLLQKDPGYPGNLPFPTYRGRKYLGGFSDHLPLILDLRVR